MALADLNAATPETTTDDIKAYAEAVVTEVAQERKGDEKSDAQITSEQAGLQQPSDKTPKTPAVKKSGSLSAVDGEEGTEAAEVDDQGDEGESEVPEWLTDEVKAEAAAFGIDESEIADFASREELDRALRLFDKSALEAGRKALAETESKGDEGTTRNEKGQFVKKEAPKADSPPPKVEGRYEFKADIYDEDLEGDLKGFRDHTESRLAEVVERLQAYEQRLAEADAVAEERHFDSLVDSLGHADLFGTTDKETAQEKQRREDLFVEVKTYMKGRDALGRPAELNAAIINRIARSLFTEELSKKELKQRTRKISKQSNARQGGGATRPQDPREAPRDEADRLYRELAGT